MTLGQGRRRRTIPIYLPATYAPPSAAIYDIDAWTQAGVPMASIVAWQDLGATPADAQHWVSLSITPAELVPYLQSGLRVSDYQAVERQMPPELVIPAVRAFPTPASVVRKHDSRIWSPAAAPTPSAPPPSEGSYTDQYYRSSDGSEVHDPTHAPSSGYGQETAICADGTHSYSHHHRGTCSHHGGVEE